MSQFEYFEDEDRDQIVGAAVYQFGMFESVIWDQIIEFSISKESFEMFKRSTRGGIKAALDLLTALILNHVYPTGKRPGFEEFFEFKNEILGLFEKRNLIAHNPIEFWFDPFTDDAVIYNGIRVSKKYPSDPFDEQKNNSEMDQMDLKKIKEITQKAEDIRYRFMNLMSRLSPHRAY